MTAKPPPPFADPRLWRAALSAAAPSMRALLQDSLKIPSVSGSEGDFTRFIQDWAEREGFQTDLWEANEADLAAWPQSRLAHLPLAHRPVLVIRLPGNSSGPTIIFNAHADVVAAGDPALWRFGPWSGEENEGRIYGRGACDVKGPLVSALWAMRTLREVWHGRLARDSNGRDARATQFGDVLLELIPGEEDCVGLGTLASIARGWRADAAIVLEPTECIPCCASRAGCRFQIVCHGRAIHGTVKWLGIDAIAILHAVLESLKKLESRWNERNADPLFSTCPIARPVTVDSIHGGEWQGMVCDRAECAGYLELLPGDDMKIWKRRFEEDLLAEMEPPLAESGGHLEIRFTEEYSGHRTPLDDPLCRIAAGVAQKSLGVPASAGIRGFNAGCEAGVRAAVHGTPTLVWGPGSLAAAHAPDEFVAFDEVDRVAAMFTELLLNLNGAPR